MCQQRHRKYNKQYLSHMFTPGVNPNPRTAYQYSTSGLEHRYGNKSSKVGFQGKTSLGDMPIFVTRSGEMLAVCRYELLCGVQLTGVAKSGNCEDSFPITAHSGNTLSASSSVSIIQHYPFRLSSEIGVLSISVPIQILLRSTHPFSAER